MLFLLFYLPFIICGGLVHHDSVYFGVRDGILSALTWLAYPLMILFSVLAFFEKIKESKKK